MLCHEKPPSAAGPSSITPARGTTQPPGPTAPLHVDWQPTVRSRDDEVKRLMALGATLHEDHRTADGRGWVTLPDPEGNEFCIEQGKGRSTAQA
ncbi:VOC family protein [Micromonospora chersina]|uniref:VOC family protein n=1 Tax=Micromonospora chersina TaxID=47854 RepID=UPI0033D0CF1B